MIRSIFRSSKKVALWWSILMSCRIWLVVWTIWEQRLLDFLFSKNQFLDRDVHNTKKLEQKCIFMGMCIRKHLWSSSSKYEQALLNKVEKEFQDDFKSFSQMLSCATQYEMEYQFQSVWVQEEGLPRPHLYFGRNLRDDVRGTGEHHV